MNTCGAVIRNRRHLYTKSISRTSYANAYHDRANNYPQYTINKRYRATPTPFTTSCTATSTSTTPCFSISIKGTTFENFG